MSTHADPTPEAARRAFGAMALGLALVAVSFSINGFDLLPDALSSILAISIIVRARRLLADPAAEALTETFT